MRTLNPVNLAAAQSAVPWIIDFVKITFDNQGNANSILRVCNGHHDIMIQETDSGGTVTTQTYLATGQFLAFGDISDELEIKNNSLDLSLSGVKGEFTSTFVRSNSEGSLVEVSRGYYSESDSLTFGSTSEECTAVSGVFNSTTEECTISGVGGTVVATPEPRWAGRVNNASIQDDYNFTDEDKIIVSVSCKSLFETLFKRQSGRYTSLQGFQKFNSADLSMEFMASIALFTPSFGKDN